MINVEQLSKKLDINDKLTPEKIKYLVSHMTSTSIEHYCNKFAKIYEKEWDECAVASARTGFIKYYSCYFTRKAQMFQKLPPPPAMEEPIKR